MNELGRWVLTIAVAAGLAGGLAAGCGKKKRGSGPDLSNPKSAAIAFTRAIETGDVNTAQVAAYASGIEIELVEAMAQAMPELKKLDEAAVAKYGEEARTILENPAMLNSSKALEEAEVAMDAGRAKLTNKQGQVITQLKEINGDWKVDVGVSIAGRDVSQRVPALRALAKTAAEVTEGIKAGKFATAADAKRELQMKMVVELHGGKPPETQPSSVLAPSTKTAPPGDDLGLP